MLADCFARYDAKSQRIEIGNGRIEEIIVLRDSHIAVQCITDRVNGKAWAGGPALWQRIPVLGAEEIPQVQFPGR